MTISTTSEINQLELSVWLIHTSCHHIDKRDLEILSEISHFLSFGYGQTDWLPGNGILERDKSDLLPVPFVKITAEIKRGELRRSREALNQISEFLLEIEPPQKIELRIDGKIIIHHPGRQSVQRPLLSNES